ncbi:MAG: RluA family pseudouridine synthase [Clostridiales bacterium]|nr:RluA family pseudouridine synthase [Clostridiales bacterium]
MTVSEWRVDEADRGRRLDALAAERAGLTRSRAEKLIRDGYAAIDGRAETKPGYAVRPGQAVALTLPAAAPIAAAPQDIPLDVVYEDADLAVVFKPSGMVVHPAAGNPDGTMVNALLARLTGLSGIGGALRPGIVHRIDKDTSGLLLVAKNDFSHLALSEQIRRHTVERAYLAIAQGRFSAPEGDVDGPIGRHPTERKRMAIVPGGREAHTHYRVIRELRGASLVEARLTTGRTHQIRVHLASLGHPLLGDRVYGPKKQPFSVEGGQLLHAWQLGFAHPTTGEFLSFTAPPEARFQRWLDKLTMDEGC